MVVSSSVPVFDDSEFLLAGMDFVTKITDPKVSIEKLVTAAAAALGSDMGSFYKLNPAKRVLEPYVTVNFPAEYAAACGAVVGTLATGAGFDAAGPRRNSIPFAVPTSSGLTLRSLIS